MHIPECAFRRCTHWCYNICTFLVFLFINFPIVVRAISFLIFRKLAVWRYPKGWSHGSTMIPFPPRMATFIHGERMNPSWPAPYFLEIRSSKIFILSVICIAVFTDIFLYGMIVPVIPRALTERCDVPEDKAQHWVSILLAVYGAALLVASPIVGFYADNSSSRRIPLLFGLVCLAGATVMLCLARSTGLLIAGRVLQGFAAAIVWVVGSALLVDTVGEKDVGQLMGYVSISMNLAVLVAPLLGGIVYTRTGYINTFWMAFGLISLDIVLRLILIEKKVAAQWADPESEIKPSVEPKPITRDTVKTPATQETQETQDTSDWPLRSPLQVPPQPAHEILNSRPIPPDQANSQDPTPSYTLSHIRKAPIFTLLRSRRLLAALWGCLVNASLMTAFDSVVPLFVQSTFHWDATGAGLVFLAVMVPSFSAPLFGAISDRYGARWLVVLGFILACPFWILLRLIHTNTLNQKVLFCALLALIGFALSLVQSPLMAEITYVVEAKEKKNPGIFGKSGAYAQAYGLFIMAFAGGCLVGPLWAGYVRDAAGWKTMSLTLGLFSIIGAVPALIWTGGYIGSTNAKTGSERSKLGDEGEKGKKVEAV